MQPKILPITIDLYDHTTEHKDYVLVTNDTKAYKFDFSIVEKRKPYDLSDINLISIVFVRKDGQPVYSECTIDDAANGKVSYLVKTTEISVPGPVIAELQFYGSDGERLTSVNFTFKVRGELDNGEGIISDDRYPILTELFTDMKQTENTIKTNEVQRQTAENTRQANETTRQQNEAIRQQQEAARQQSMQNIKTMWDNLSTAQQEEAEVINMRTSISKGKSFPQATDRLEEIEADLAEIPQRGMLKFLSMLQAGLISKIKLIGDSITAGEGATGHTVPVDNPIIFDDGAGNVFREGCYDCRCWANYFREYIKANYPTVQFINAGIGGASAKWADENKQYWVDDDEDVVFVQLGTNDRSQSASIPAFKASLKSFLSYIRARSNLVIVMTANPALTDGSFPFGMDKIDAAISELCIEENYPHISNFRDMLDYSINSKTRLVELVQGAAYGSHPVDAGHLFMWQNIQQKLGIIDGYTNWDNFLKRVPVYNLPADSVTATTPITDFQFGITICNITPTGATGFPGNASGVYTVYRSDVNDLYSYAEYRLRSNGFTYRRIHGASGWGSFVFYIPVINKSDDSVSGSSPLSYFQSNAITRIEIGGSHPNIATFPDGAAGTLITHREGADLTAYQEYFIRGTNRVYKRYWKTSAWAQWAAIEGARYATADRPTADLSVGYSYFDTTLGKPLWLKATSPRYIWVDSTGAEV